MNNNTMPPQFKFAATIVIWIIVAVILLTMLRSGEEFNWVFGIIMLGIAGGVTGSIMGADGGKNNTTASAKAEETIAKAKRGGNLAEMLSMLDDEDVYEIRQRIKQRLLDRVDNGSDEDVESFEQLLSARDRQKRR
jgi:hypothetical protein